MPADRCAKIKTETLSGVGNQFWQGLGEGAVGTESEAWGVMTELLT